VLAEWKSDQDVGTDDHAADPLVYRTIENIHLVKGAVVTVSVRSPARDGNGGGRFDRVEIWPTQGTGSPLRFEAEYMKLDHFRVEAVKGASGGKVVALRGSSGSAQFQFPADDGLYTLKVRYLPDSDGKASFALSVKDPVAEEK
jgi:hypothetical protein